MTQVQVDEDSNIVRFKPVAVKPSAVSRLDVQVVDDDVDMEPATADLSAVESVNLTSAPPPAVKSPPAAAGGDDRVFGFDWGMVYVF